MDIFIGIRTNGLKTCTFRKYLENSYYKWIIKKKILTNYFVPPPCWQRKHYHNFWKHLGCKWLIHFILQSLLPYGRSILKAIQTLLCFFPKPFWQLPGFCPQQFLSLFFATLNQRRNFSPKSISYLGTACPNCYFQSYNTLDTAEVCYCEVMSTKVLCFSKVEPFLLKVHQQSTSSNHVKS